MKPITYTTETWDAGQIASSHDAYIGRKVKFTHGGATIQGILTESDIFIGRTTFLVIGDLSIKVPNETLIEVYR